MRPKSYFTASLRTRASVGDSIRRFREQIDLSQMQLSALTRLPLSTIAALEHNRMSLGPDSTSRIARALKVHPSMLVVTGWNNGPSHPDGAA